MFRSFVLETPKKFQWQLDGNHDYALETETNQLKVTDYFMQDGILFSHGWKLDVSQRFGYFFYKPI